MSETAKVPPVDAGPLQAEQFHSRGVGMDDGMPCFVCGAVRRNDTANTYMNNISGYVQSRFAGMRVQAMFNHKPRLDYREYEPSYIQLKVGACDKHLEALKDLHERTSAAGGVILPRLIEAVFQGERWRLREAERKALESLPGPGRQKCKRCDNVYGPGLSNIKYCPKGGDPDGKNSHHYEPFE